MEERKTYWEEFTRVEWKNGDEVIKRFEQLFQESDKEIEDLASLGLALEFKKWEHAGTRCSLFLIYKGLGENLETWILYHKSSKEIEYYEKFIKIFV